MPDHVLRVCASVGTDRLGLWCSCDPTTLLLHGLPGAVYGLAELNAITDRHICAAEDEGPGEGYRTRSALTSEDTLIDLAHPYDEDGPQLGEHIRSRLS